MRTRWKSLVLSTGLIVVMTAGCTKKEAEPVPNPVHSSKAGIEWMTDIEKGIEMAGAEHKPIMIDFMATWCPPCKAMEDSTFHDDRVIQKAESFITVRIDVDEQPDVANKYKSNAGKYGGIGIPNVLFLDAHGAELKHPIGYKSPETFLAIMDSVLQDAAQHHH